MSIKSLSDRLARVAVLPLLLLSSAAMAGYEQLNMTQGVTPLSKDIYDLHMIIMWICVAIGVVVFGIMFWSIFYHRKSRGAVASQFHHSTKAEIAWTIIPILILVGMAIPATKVLIAMENTGDSEMSIKVTGYQWKWEYDYIDEGVSFFSTLDSASNQARQLRAGLDPNEVPNYLLDVDNPVVVPVDTKIRFLTTANDVIHAWWVPDLGWKRDAIPGFINESWAVIEEPGTYRGQCAELCGRDHGFMPIVLVAKEKDEYEKWLAEKKAEQEKTAEADREWSMDELMAKGEEVYGTNCAACHQANGEGVEGAFPSLTESDIIFGPKEDHVDVVLHGVDGTTMAAFGDQLSDAEIAAVVTYERNAWGNEMGDMVQPSEVNDLR
ncbi:cytochrome c oxidase subunit 2 [Methylohalomonas lacus]|uniref:Cytochrome c oxidase subunit 2 n=1 Tax=Methylohalomonas lacus TaxID=398773 RepID=A0AAE3HJ40_9GAMM|nr:cytochrome c oxidase subunit II [Methylohalomonas lacus]MCS3903319.1 cytochrome c oxidase subunit 2 [Methylohalomonas lacus]